jgi:hypothetical protein
MENWNKLIKRTGRVEEIGARLDALSHRDRLAAVRSMRPPTHSRLWEMADGTVLTLEDIVPKEVPPLTEVIHYGKNSAPAFSHFQKRFCRPSPGSNEDLLFGYNEQPFRFVVGPGYFVVRETPHSHKGPVVFDYYSSPTEKVGSWPEIASTDYGIPAITYGYMNDYVRRVSSHVTIGRVWKFHKRADIYFILCREPT